MCCCEREERDIDVYEYDVQLGRSQLSWKVAHLSTNVFEDVRLQPHLEVDGPNDEAERSRLYIEDSL